ncbi:hypothetical protein SAMN05421837_103976 [Amycolatopsis pretoriensis]|uniref:Uncharacterized protein n=1 Tax=Amycolatopsis pretoriensis TaxID=218821 RepID=A0A1H5QNL1_9PSEU|nr:hypothetical protein [Amycolatopsis pretoriensis]SEF27649.1 hypothetical protein SAMN05421837_103976 [Amycolatopsis pretoriensis]
MTSPFDHEALWIKAKLFLNRAMDDGARSFDEQALWAALALELLAKAALSRVSPLLIAEPNEEGTNLLIASGLIQGDARFTSVRAKTLMARCHKAFKPFDQAEAMKIINGRNEYLHSSGAGFLAIPPHAWWPRYWAQATTLVTALDRDIEELVGADREHTVTKHLEQNAKNLEQRTEALIERAKQRRQQWLDETLSAKVAAEWKTGQALSAQMVHSEAVACPACGSTGLLEGDEVVEVETHYPEATGYGPDEYEVGAWDDASVTLTISADYFSCPSCQLVLNSYDLINQAGLDIQFEAEGDVDDYLPDEPDYGND